MSPRYGFYPYTPYTGSSVVLFCISLSKSFKDSVLASSLAIHCNIVVFYPCPGWNSSSEMCESLETSKVVWAIKSVLHERWSQCVSGCGLLNQEFIYVGVVRNSGLSRYCKGCFVFAGLIRLISKHHSQIIYTRATKADAEEPAAWSR